MQPISLHAVRSVLEFLAPTFSKLEGIYKLFCPLLYEKTLEKLEAFKSSKFHFIIYLFIHFSFIYFISELSQPLKLKLPFSLWTACWLSIQCFTYSHTDSDLGDQGLSGTITGGNLQDSNSFGIADWYNFSYLFFKFIFL